MKRISLSMAVVALAGSVLSGVATHAAAASIPDPGVTGCDVLVSALAGHNCLLPWPNDAFTKKAATATGRQINLPLSGTPANVHGVHINPRYQNLNDGFSPGSEIVVPVPGISLENSNIATSQSLGLSDTMQNVMLIDATTGQHYPYWAELDAQDPNSSDSLLLIHPATNFLEGHRIVVVLQNLRDTSNRPIPEATGMVAALAGKVSPSTRGAHLKYVVQHDLAGQSLSNLYMAWDFTVITGGGNVKKLNAGNLADPALSMRQQAFATLGTTTPVYKVTSAGLNGNGDWEVNGIFQVPTFLSNCPTTLTDHFVPTNNGQTDTTGASTATGACGGMNVDKNNLPLEVKTSYSMTTHTWSNQIWADFICVMPGTPQSTPALATLYGHGLLGSAGEVINSEHKGVLDNVSGCATDWTGMSNNDALIVAGSLNDMSNFHTNVEHMLQGFVNFQVLGRLLISPKGFATDPAFQSGGTPRIAFGAVQYQGYSQGGIMGGALSAISTEWTRAVLGVPGQNYGGILLDRSVDWSAFASVYDAAYPNAIDQEMGLQITQMLWDRGENDGYSEHLTANPYGGTKAKAVYAIENYGDHQVSNLGAESLLRTIGASVNQPSFANTSWPTSRVNLPVTFQAYLPALDYTRPVKAAGILWDYGTPTPPTVNLAPSGSAYGQDPHGFGRRTPGLIDQIKGFFQTGYLADICHGACVGVPGA